ncbi:MAG: Rpn family recombination-promoting nuclease/putative transposase [Thermoguttaceae bacterium]|nr:Rpn family recombination-promoting nuclease/putative transposase [Thermoguttaceae bacterium]
METEKRRVSSVHLYQDRCFRAVFGSEEAKGALLGLLNSILAEAKRPRAADLTLTNPFLLPKDSEDKSPILDIRAVDENGRLFDVEMQVCREPGFIKRALYYLSKTHSSSQKIGDGYHKVAPTISVWIIGFPLNPQKPNLWFDVWSMRSECESGEGSKDLTIIFLQLPLHGEVPVGIDDFNLDKWAGILSRYWSITDEEWTELESTVQGVKELREIMSDFVGSDLEQYLIEAEKDFNARIADIRYAEREEGREEGREQGREEGREEGALNEKKKTAAKLLRRGWSIEEIAEFLGVLTVDIEIWLADETRD